MTFLSTNAVKPKDAGGKTPLRGVVTSPAGPNDTGERQKFTHTRGGEAKGVSHSPIFNFDTAQFKDAKPRPSMFKNGPIQTNMLRDMADNKKRLEASQAKKAAIAKAEAEGKVIPVAKKRGRKGK